VLGSAAVYEHLFSAKRVGAVVDKLIQSRFVYSSIANKLHSVRTWLTFLLLDQKDKEVRGVLDCASTLVKQQQKVCQKKRKKQEADVTVEELEDRGEWTTLEKLDNLLLLLLPVYG